MIPFESALERDFATLLEFMPDVHAYEAQPLRLDYEAATGRRTHGYPDFLVTFVPGYGPPLLVDVKYRAEIGSRWKTLKPRFKAAMRYAKERGWLYRLKTETEIRTTYLSNARFLLPFLRCRPDPVHAAILMDRLIPMRFTTVEKLLAAGAQTDDIRAILIPTLWCLVAHRNIAITLDEPLRLDSIIWDPLTL